MFRPFPPRAVEIIEAAKALKLDKSDYVFPGTEGAYQRSDLLEQRRPLMSSWASYVGGGTVVAFPRRAGGSMGRPHGTKKRGPAIAAADAIAAGAPYRETVERFFRLHVGKAEGSEIFMTEQHRLTHFTSYMLDELEARPLGLTPRLRTNRKRRRKSWRVAS